MQDSYKMGAHYLGTRDEKVFVYERGYYDTPLCYCDDLTVALKIAAALNKVSREREWDDSPSA